MTMNEEGTRVSSRSDAIVIVDAHVHVYPQFDAARLLFSAHENFARHIRANHAADAAWQGVLMLSETHACDWFAQMHAKGATTLGGWRLQAADDEISLLATGPSQQRVHIVAGRQINTREGVEVLTLASTVRIADGAPLESTLKEGVGAGAVVVLPWGAGKWLGRRGELVARTLQECRDRIFAGDNSGRPWIWPRPAIFAASEAQGRPVLPGTDPLPLAGCEKRVGSYGFVMRGALRELQPGLDLRERLFNAAALQAFGKRESLGGFALNQMKLRLA
jgi:hypothetical protein